MTRGTALFEGRANNLGKFRSSTNVRKYLLVSLASSFECRVSRLSLTARGV